MDVYKTEDEQIEAIKKWWRENGFSIIAGVAIGFTAIFGWRAWDNHTIMQAEAASTLNQQMVSASRENDSENVRIYAERIIADHESSTYAVFASLMLAKLAAESNDLANAETQLRWAMQTNSQAEIEHIIRLRLSRVLIAMDKLDMASDSLNISDVGEFKSRYEELRGDILVKQGKFTEAQQAYQSALASSTATGDARTNLQMKLDDLGRI